MRARFDHAAALKAGEEAAANERGFAAPGGANDGDEAIALEARDEFERLFLAAEEKLVLIAAKRAQAGEGVREGGFVFHDRGLLRPAPNRLPTEYTEHTESVTRNSVYSVCSVGQILHAFMTGPP
jgi:hypothetical protein